MGRENKEPQGLGIVFLQYLADGEEVAQRLAHFFAVDIHKTVVQPVANKLTTISRFGLGDFVLVMREDQVFSSAMDVKGLAEKLHAHRGALDMPAGPPFAPG